MAAALVPKSESRRALAAQLKRLEARSDADAELLVELRSFLRDRARIDEEYGRALEKLSRTYMARKLKRGPTLVRDGAGKGAPTAAAAPRKDGGSAPHFVSDDGHVRPMYEVYLTMVTECERAGRSAITAAERMASGLTESLKDYHRLKTSTSKKAIEYATKYHQNLFTVFEELDRTKAVYEKAAKEAESARRRYDDVVRKPNSGLNAIKNMMSRGDGDDRVDKLQKKWEAATQSLATCRNDYLLALEAANAMQNRYYNTDLADLMT
ncbi:F-BAR and double SH3 domains protein 1, partial [Cladochytrium tenue]